MKKMKGVIRICCECPMPGMTNLRETLERNKQNYCFGRNVREYSFGRFCTKCGWLHRSEDFIPKISTIIKLLFCSCEETNHSLNIAKLHCLKCWKIDGDQVEILTLDEVWDALSRSEYCKQQYLRNFKSSIN